MIAIANMLESATTEELKNELYAFFTTQQDKLKKKNPFFFAI
jgi:hypothetical protein